jgi:hypothetical protein
VRPNGRKGSVIKDMLAVAAAAVVAWAAMPLADVTDAPEQSVPAAQEQAAVPPEATPGEGLRDLDAMTFGCPKAALNAAAREAGKAPSQGTYQFSFFRIVSDSHHAAYEVHFKSNYEGEPDRRYCVEIYCQQGWDPKTTKTTVTAMSDRRPRRGAMTHGAVCAGTKTPAKAPAKRTVKQ